MKEDEFSDLFDVGGSQSEVKDVGLSPEIIALLNKSKIEANKAVQSQEEENEVPESFEEDEPEEVAEISIDKSVKPFDFGQKQDSNLTNLDFLSRMLYRDLRGYLRQNYKWLSRKFSKELLETFMEICHKISDNDVETSLLEIVLKDMGIIDIRKDIILKNYDLIRQDESKVICKSTYEKFREIVSREYIERTIVPSDAVKSLERLQNSDFFLPPFGVIESDTFKQCVFGDFDMSTIMEDLGAPLISNFEPLNEISPIGGYLPGQVTMVSGPPGCFVGSTKVRTSEGLETIHNLYLKHTPPSVLYTDMDKHTVDWSWENKGARKIGEGTKFTKVFVSTQPEFPIVCTDNHKFLVMDKFTGCKWVEAHDLQAGDIIYSHPGINYVTVLKIEDVVYNKAVPYYDIVDSGEYSNYFINAGSEDICVHNSGKSLFMMSEAISAIKQGKKVVYAAIGDLKQFDFASRICAMILQIPISKVAINLPNYFKMVNNLFPELKKNMTVQFISPNKYTAEEWLKMNEQSGLIKDSDVFFIDYDTNFASEKDSMYAKGDEVYTMAFVLSQKPGGKYVFIGSQPKVGNWRDDKLGLETASESSRKQQIIDVMVTISVDKDVRNVRNHLGVINVPKNRRGGMTSFDYFLDPTGLMVPITQEARNVIKMDTSIVSVIESKNYDITTHLIPNARKYKSDSELVEGEEYLALPAEDAN